MSRYSNYKTVEYFESSQPSFQQPKLKLLWDTKNIPTTADPRVWGPCMWLFLHTSAAHYPQHPSNDTKEATKNFIRSLPYILPCDVCKAHAKEWVSKYSNKDLNKAVSSRDNLFKFYVEFHNYVNERYGKKLYSYQEVYDCYRNGIQVCTLKY